MNSTRYNFIKIINKGIKTLFVSNLSNLDIHYTRQEFKGYITLVIYPLVKELKISYSKIGKSLGDYVKYNSPIIKSFNLIKGFLNFELTDIYYCNLMEKIDQEDLLCLDKPEDNYVMIEYSSPNTNKPFHLGHVRNLILGHALAELLKAVGYKVIKTQIINDRGIHICKSMTAWLRFANGATPKIKSIKGDHFVGKYYLLFEKVYRKEVAFLLEKGFDKHKAEQKSIIMQSARHLLHLWENYDAKVIDIWQKMNSWVLKGFEQTYIRLGIKFDYIQYESKTYLLGKNLIYEGLKKEIFFKKKDGSVWVNLTDEGLSEKILLRNDGTSVYITQDLGTALERFTNYPIKSMIYIVGDEQKYHFQVLFIILQRLGYAWADKLLHLSYGMIYLTDGRMKSREGNVIYADDMIQHMYNTAKNITKNMDSFSENEKKALSEIISMGALKFYLLKVAPKRSIIFDTKSSIEFTGHTGTYIQYTYARICSIQRKKNILPKAYLDDYSLNNYEILLLKSLEKYFDIVRSAAEHMNPAIVANYTYDLAKSFNDFYQNVRIIKNHCNRVMNFRLKISYICGRVLKAAMHLLGIALPERM